MASYSKYGAGRSGEALLIAAYSGRAIAKGARRAGYAPLVADLFCDEDTQASAELAVQVEGSLEAGFAPASLSRALRELAHQAGGRRAGIVYGAGFEMDPALLDALREVAPVLGNPADVVSRIKNPRDLAKVCAVLGISHPETLHSPPLPGEAGWLLKRQGGAGGTNTRPWPCATPDGLTERHYWQRFVSGEMLSVLFLADGERASVVGFSEQWTSPSQESPFRFGGAVTCNPPDELRAALTDCAARLAKAFALRGLNSADFIVSGETFHLIEVNPRPGATFDLFDHDEHPLLAAHVEACRGNLPAQFRPLAFNRAVAIVYADVPLVAPHALRWPDWAADRPAAGTFIDFGHPICTVFATGRSPSGARSVAFARSDSILSQLRATQPARHFGECHAHV